MKINNNLKLNSSILRDYLDREMRKQSFFIKALGVSPSLVNMMLNEQHIPKERTLQKLADLLGVEKEELLLPLVA